MKRSSVLAVCETCGDGITWDGMGPWYAFEERRREYHRAVCVGRELGHAPRYPFLVDGSPRWACCMSLIGPTCEHMSGSAS